jgi:hypothetical protein
MARRIAPLQLVGLTFLLSLNAILLTAVVGAAPDAEGTADRHDFAVTLELPTAPAFSPSAISAYDQILAQPVFFKTRQPFVAPPPVAPPQSRPAPIVFVDPGFAVGGIVIKGSARRAYIFRNVDPNGSWVGEGETILGWKVTSIRAGSAELQKDDHMITLRLYVD